MNRAYSLIELKAVDEEQRVIEGIATTPAPDRVGDIVEPKGMKFKLPLPLLHQHDKDKPIGHVLSAKVTADGIYIKAKLAEPGLLDYVDTAWKQIKSGLIRGLSIGFRSMKSFSEDWDEKLEAFRFTSTEWLELSAVTVPANAEATILTVKSIDNELLAASGKQSISSVQKQPVITINGSSTRPGVSGLTQGKSMKTISEQIASFEAKRAANQARMDEIMGKSFEEGSTLGADQKVEYDGLEADMKEIDEHLVRLRAHEQRVISKATPVTPANTGTVEKAAAIRSGQREPIQVRSAAPKGVGMARVAIAMIRAQNNPFIAAQLAKQYWPDNPEIEMTLKAGVDAGDTTTSGWASQLVPAAQQLQDEFLDLLRPATILGRIPNLRRVPFNVAIPIRTAGGTFGWVGEGVGKPVTSETFSSVTLRWAKAAGIIVITQELAKFSSPSAEVIIRDSMIKSLTRFLDVQFVGSAAEVTNVSPAGILNGISAVNASGTTAAAFRTDMNNMLNNFTANNIDPGKIVVLMSSTTALALSLAVTDLGVPLFPEIGPQGGSVLKIPAIVSENVGNKIIGLNAEDILLAEDGGIRIDVSDQASVEMETVPAQGDQSPITALTNLKSFWQNNLVGIRAEQFITWKAGRTSAVEFIQNVAYVP